MKRASSVLPAISVFVRLFTIAAAATLLCACGSSFSALEPEVVPANLIRITQAELATATPGDLTHLPPKELPPLPALAWKSVALPYALPRAVAPSVEETDPLQMDSLTVWYRIRIDESPSRELSALYLPRWHTWGNLSVYANGLLLYSSLQEGTFSSFNDPLLIRLPAELLAGKVLEITVRMDSIRAVGGALSSIWAGPIAELRPLYTKRRLLQNLMPQITSVVFLVLGVFAFGFWIRRRHEVSQLLFFTMSVLFYLRNLHYYVDDTALSVEWFQWMTVYSLGWLNIVAYLFACRTQGWRNRVLDRIFVGAMALASLLSMPFGWFQNTVAIFSSFTYLLFMGVSFAVTIRLSFAAWRVRSFEGAMLAAVLWLNLGLGIHDWLLQNWRIDIESFYMLPYGVFALFLFFLTSELRRYLSAVAASEKASAVLESRLILRERELNESHQRLRAIEQAQLLSEERQRLMREMHDGLGSALMSSLVAVERGQMKTDDIAQVLRECVDDLKLTIDSLEPIDADLLMLLATLRYRLETRLIAAGVRLIWEVEAVPSLPWLNPSSALQILRMLQEILVNVLKHAKARHIRVTTRVTTDESEPEVWIAVMDDGVGFDMRSFRPGRGLKNLRRRAEAIGGRITIESRQEGDSGTCVSIALPIERSEPTTASNPVS